MLRVTTDLRSRQLQRLAGASLLVFANKQDVDNALTPAEIKEVRCAHDLRLKLWRNVLLISLSGCQALDLPSIKSHRWRIQPCSAVTGENLIEGLDWVTTDVAGR